MKSFFVAIFAILLSNLTIAQSPSIEELFQQISDYGSTITVLNMDGTMSQQLQLLEQLETTASINELKQGLQHENPLVQLYSYWIVKDHLADEFRSNYKLTLKSNPVINIINGCFIETTYLHSLLNSPS